jgi:hypothetical protein
MGTNLQMCTRTSSVTGSPKGYGIGMTRSIVPDVKLFSFHSKSGMDLQSLI